MHQPHHSFLPTQCLHLFGKLCFLEDSHNWTTCRTHLDKIVLLVPLLTNNDDFVPVDMAVKCTHLTTQLTKIGHHHPTSIITGLGSRDKSKRTILICSACLALSIDLATRIGLLMCSKLIAKAASAYSDGRYGRVVGCSMACAAACASCLRLSIISLKGGQCFGARAGTLPYSRYWKMRHADSFRQISGRSS